MAPLRTLVESRPSNAAITWSLVAALVVDAAASVLVGDLLRALYAVALVAAVSVPQLLARDGTLVIAWQALALATVPVAARWLGIFPQAMAYVSVAALALVVVAEVDAFSSVEMPPWFAVLFVVLTTTTVAGVWGVVQYFADAVLGTSYLTDRAELMWDLVAATVVGAGAGVVFELLFRAVDRHEPDADGVGDR